MSKRPLAELDAWRVKQSEPALSRADAIRHLVEVGLTALSKAAPAGPRNAVRAKELAAREIDMLSDAGASTQEQGQRKRALMEGPSEFRADRLDLLKAKRR